MSPINCLLSFRGGGELSQDFKNCVKHKAEMSVNVITGRSAILVNFTIFPSFKHSISILNTVYL